MSCPLSLPLLCVGAGFVGGFATAIGVVWLRASWLMTFILVQLASAPLSHPSLRPHDVPLTNGTVIDVPVLTAEIGPQRRMCVGKYVVIEQPGEAL